MLAALLVVATLAGCSDPAPTQVIGPSPAPATTPTYDPGLEPAATVLAIVPDDARVLEVTDFDQVRLSLGAGELTGASDPATRRAFWNRADREAPLLSPGMLRDPAFEAQYGVTQDDVSWEAHFSGPAGDGYVLKFRDDLDMTRVQRAAAAGSGPLAGATVVPSAQIAALGATREPTQSWAAEPDLVGLVGDVASATYVSRDCLGLDEALGADVSGQLAPTPAADLAALDTLGPFSVEIGSTLVTVHLGPQRPDVFDRARLAERLPATDPEFGLGYVDPVADPLGGRIGYRLGNGPVAARLARERHLPFAVCGA